MRPCLALLLSCLSVPALAASPVAAPSRLPAPWQAKMRSFLQQIIETPSVVQRGQVPKVAEAVAAQLRAAGFPAEDIQILPYEGLPGDKTAALLFRWKADKPTAKPMLVIGHMDVVEAKREDWKNDPFQFLEKDGYFYGRGTSDMKTGIAATTLALAKLKAEGFKPKRDIILFFTGDEETQQNGALLGSTEWKGRLDGEFALNADGGGGAFDTGGRPLGFALDAAEKTYQTYFFTVRNKGGHSSRPRPDNAIYQLGDALKKLETHRFAPQLNEVTRAYFQARQQDEKGALGDAMRRWLANPNDGEAADAIEASELEVGKTRTRCVATMLSGGHADNALPQMARATVNCRIMPGVEPAAIQAELQALVGRGVEIVPDPSFIGKPTPVPAIRPDVLAAYTEAVQGAMGKTMRVIPNMATGTSDASFFRSAGIPTYGVDGGWGISPDDERAHGLDERIPVRAAYDDVLHWETMVRELAGK
ncbi:M20/M25/M40 family metallo-hydrolase [Sphingomonas astaxanthinifaciens]|uniref:Peptidase M20 n=1 Tax=Sphingomonas astaxanthinifaciens DSM 22298 TaxID=1123267 RepID=A0ABQ5Z3X8_9SPHN|nr:M20/M25/M40 family metallo-hydrolase [Sphingomonas astaxanthinifaciens]GLR47500.1 peptidase M20 [Sphingomonas astaxanthinifaciens DSM 22298]